MLVQYGDCLWKLLHGDLGVSVTAQGVSVTAEVSSAAKWTLGLVVFGIVVSFLLGVVLGVVAALRRSSVVGDGLSIVGSLLHGVPQYVMALILVTLLTVRWHLFETVPSTVCSNPGSRRRTSSRCCVTRSCPRSRSRCPASAGTCSR